MAFLSKRCVYGIRAVLFVSTSTDESPESEYQSIRLIADELNLSFHFLTKILQDLTKEGILQSFRGPKGGIKLGRPSKTITILDILHAIEGEDIFELCILGLPNCNHDSPCPLHQDWVHNRSRMKDMFSTTTLDQISSGLRTSAFRINASGKISFANR